MDHSLPAISKRLWNVVRAVLFMLRKGISKNKLIHDLNMMIKSGKIVRKALGNLKPRHRHPSSFSAPHEYEFSCSNSPAFPFPLNTRRHHHHGSTKPFFACTHPPPTQDVYDLTTLKTAAAVLEKVGNDVALTSPALPGFGPSPGVQQLRVTDSPFPVADVEGNDGRIDKAAEEFIERFYRQLKQQK